MKVFCFLMLATSYLFGAVGMTIQAQDPNALIRISPRVLQNIELTDVQREKIRELSEEFRARVRSIRQAEGDVYTEDQHEARREAIRIAREKQLTGPGRRELIENSLELSDEQLKQLGLIAQQKSDFQQEMRQAYLAVLTPEQQSGAEKRDRSNRDGPNNDGRNNDGRNPDGRNRTRIEPTHANVSYGPHNRHVMDVWLAESEHPTPVLFSIHGGGFRGGNKGVDPGLLQACLDAEISVVAITYRLSQDAIAPAAFYDSARAVQFVRHNAERWKIDKTRVASSGGSAGAGISLWLAFHDDLAQKKFAGGDSIEKSNDEEAIARESTRVSCAFVFNGQTTYDPRVIQEIIPEAGTAKHGALSQLYGVDLTKGWDNLDSDKLKLFEECSPLFHLTKDDVPVLLAYAGNLDSEITSQGIGIHHPRFGSFLQKQMEPLGIECLLETRIRRGSDEWIKQSMEFMQENFAK